MALRQVEEAGAWPALAACVVTIILAAGSRTTLAAFLHPIEADLHLDRTVLSTAGALTVLTYGLAQPLVGALSTRLGLRNVMLGGVILTALGGLGVATALAAVVVGLGGLAQLWIPAAANVHESRRLLITSAAPRTARGPRTRICRRRLFPCWCSQSTAAGPPGRQY